MNVLVLNSGSSSLKFQVIATDLEQIKQYKDDRVCKGELEGIGGEAIIHIRYRDQPSKTLTAPIRDMSAALDYIVRYIASEQSGVSEIKSTADVHAVGHRVVHGGELFKESTLVDDKVIEGIESCIDLAPLHNPNNVKGILAARDLFGKDVPQVAVFDTSFHHSLPEQAYLYAVPYHLYRRHRIRRYGFPRHLSPIRSIPLPRLARHDAGTDQYHHVAPRKWMFGGCDQSRNLGRHIDGHDATRRPGDGNALRRSGSGDCWSDCAKRRNVVHRKWTRCSIRNPDCWACPA